MTNHRNDYSESLLVHFCRRQDLKEEALSFRSHNLNKRQLCDLELLLNGGYYPLNGFMGQGDYESVIGGMRLQDRTVWPIPVCLDVNETVATGLNPGDSLALNDPEGLLLAVLRVSEVWQPDLHREAESIYGVSKKTHPRLREYERSRNPWYIGGKIEGLQLPIHYDFRELRYTPAETASFFGESGWRNILGVHTDRLLHRADHEELINGARNTGCSILLQPAMGFIEAGDLECYTMVRCLKAFAQYFPRNMIQLGLLPHIPLGAGPREALMQAIIKRNYGCTHFLVENNHADPFADSDRKKGFYPRHAAQELVAEYAEETGISMVARPVMRFESNQRTYLPIEKIAPGQAANPLRREELRNRLELGHDIPEWFSYPEIIKELRYAYPARSRQGFTVFISGLSGAGKSTLARVLLIKFMEMRDRPVTLLDGDIVRKNLSSELDFSREHRNLNITRIGFVAHQITKNGGIALCAPIAPYPESRQANRELISRDGGFIEVYMKTPLDVCEQRDRKGLYAKARAGKIMGVTGVSDPYIPPAAPEITIDTTSISPVEAAQEVLLYLEEQGYLR